MGDRLQTSISDSWGMATVTDIKEVKTKETSGFFVYHRYEDVRYDTQPILYDDGVMSDMRSNTRRSRSGIPIEYEKCGGKDIDFGRYTGEDVTIQKKILNDFVVNFEIFQQEGNGLYIYSKTNGSGKTMIACALANEIMERYDIPVKFINVADYIELVKSKDDAGRDQAKSIMEAGLLILDDVGAQVENKDWIITALFRLIDRRYANRYPTIFTSNIKRENLKTDPRIHDRIYRMTIPVIMPEVNVRKQMADEETKSFLKSLQERGKQSEELQVFR